MAEFFGVIGQLVKTGAALVARDYQGEHAEKYDLVQAWTGDVEFYRSWLKAAGGTVLELACGTGRVGLALLQDGAIYTGLDLSRDMLAVFQEKAARFSLPPERFQLVQGDMTDFSLPRRFPLIIVPCYSYTHLAEQEQRTRFFHCCFQHLTPGGVLVMELPLWVEDEDFTGNQPRCSLHGRRGSSHVLSLYQSRPEGAGLVTLNLLYIYPGDSPGLARLEAVACQEYRSAPKELEILAAGAGFARVNLYRDYRSNPLQKGDHAAVLVARKE